MILGDAVDVIRAYYLDGKPLEWNDNGPWNTWYGNHGELFDSVKAGRIFRVKREPIECWILKSPAGEVGQCTYETQAGAEHRAAVIKWQAVLMREVLQ